MSMADFTYENFRRVIYGCKDDSEKAQFIPVCEKCGRFVKADASIALNSYGLADQPNATCKKCGRTKMIFEGFFEEE